MTPPAHPGRPRSRQTPRGGEGLIQIAVTLPLPTFEILDKEAAVYGWRKSQFLEALLMEKLGMGIHLERKPGAPKYKFKPDEWATSERWIWYLRPDLKERFDALRMRAGNVKPQAWIVLTVNQFVGLPTL